MSEKNILITGASGLIGRELTKLLLQKGYSVSILSRSINNIPNVKTYLWDIEGKFIEAEALSNVDYIIHLAGANIGEKRWRPNRKEQIVSSRVESAELLYNNLPNDNKLKAFISASAVGYYGAKTSNVIFEEDNCAASDFIGAVCQKWEKAADLFNSKAERVVKLRTGVVVSEYGGALEKIKMPIRYNVGSAIGTGKQYFPWIHISDLCNIYLKALDDDQMLDAYNAVAPEHINNKQVTLELARVMKKRIWLPNVPAFVMKILFGEMASIILEGSRVSAKKILDAGFTFKYTRFKDAIV